MNFTNDEKNLILSLLENNRNMDEFVPIEVYDSAIDKITRIFEQENSPELDSDN